MQKSVSTMIALSMVLTGLSFVPTAASAHGLKLGLGANIDANVKTDHKDNLRLNVEDKAFDIATQSARENFHAAVKAANTNYKNAKQSAKAQFKASVKIATNQTERTAALKAYLTSMSAAWKTKSLAVEVAFNAFIAAL